MKQVYTFADLESWEKATEAEPFPAKLAVIGDPIAHSRSPQMHNPALRRAGLSCQYVRLHLRPEELPEALTRMKRAGMIGFNVTIPHKTAIFEAVDEMSETARDVGAVNTVRIEGERLIGHNTDAPGLSRAVAEAFGRDLATLRVLLIGAGGGAGRAAAVQCVMEGCERLVLVNRTVEKAQALAEDLQSRGSTSARQTPLITLPWEADAIAEEVDQIDLIINATSVGMKADDAPVLPIELLRTHHLVYDMIYAPPRTRLMDEAASVGAQVANGLGMLLWQGALAFEFWFGQDASVAAMREGLSSAD